MCAGEVDDDRAGRRLDLGRARVREAEEDDVGAGRERLVVRHERGQMPVQPQIERGRRLPGERIRAERDDLELGVCEHAVERLLAGVAGAADDGGGRHCRLLCI